MGPTPLANSFLRSEEEYVDERWFPLDVYFCETCSLVQLLDVVEPETLFRNYIYVTGTSETMAAHNARYARTLKEMLGLTSEDLVVEVASNDGSLLKCFQGQGVRTLGIEPATNIAAKARANGVHTINQFFNSSTAGAVSQAHGRAKAVVANNVLAHVDEPGDFLEGCKNLLEPKGLVVIEVPYIGELLNRLEYDTMYHEHLCCFSVSTLVRLCEQVGLRIVRLDHVPVHGGSLRMYAGPAERHPVHAEEVVGLAAQERERGLTRLDTYQRFAKAVEANRESIVKVLLQLKEAGRTVAGYGAPAKGNTLLNYCRIDTDLLAFTVDKNPLKVGLFTPGMHIPVLPVSALLERQPDYVLILAWNLAEEIVSQQQEYRRRGGRFIVPIPHPRVL